MRGWLVILRPELKHETEEEIGMTALQEATGFDSAPEGRGNQLIPARRTGRIEDLEEQIKILCNKMKIAVIYGGDKLVEGAVIHRTRNPRSSYSQVICATDPVDGVNCRTRFWSS